MERELANLEAAMREFGHAWADGDLEKLTALLSPTYTHNDVFGAHLEHSDWLAYAARRTGRQTKIAFRDLKIRLFGDVAVVTGFNDITGGGATSPDDGADLTIVYDPLRVAVIDRSPAVPGVQIEAEVLPMPPRSVEVRFTIKR